MFRIILSELKRHPEPDIPHLRGHRVNLGNRAVAVLLPKQFQVPKEILQGGFIVDALFAKYVIPVAACSGTYDEERRDLFLIDRVGVTQVRLREVVSARSEPVFRPVKRQLIPTRVWSLSPKERQRLVLARTTDGLYIEAKEDRQL